MVKIVKDEQDNETSLKAKKLVKSIKAVSLAGILVVSALGGTKVVNAAQTSHSNETVDSQDDITTFLDEQFSWQFESDVKEEANQANVSEVQEVIENSTESKDPETTEYVEENIEESEDVVSEDVIYTDKRDGFTIEDIPEEYIGTKELYYIVKRDECKVVGAYDDATKDFYLVLDEVDPEIVDENYIGIAPVEYYGTEHEVKNYGDASNDEEVKERAVYIYNAFHKANEETGGLRLFNPATNKEYTLSELEDIIRWINGSYIAKDGADAKRMNNAWIDFIVVLASDGYVIEDVNYTI